MRRFFLLLLAAMAVPSFPAAAAKPNVVVILVDDMGFSDLGCYGSEIPTPTARNSLFRPGHRKRLESGSGPEERGGLVSDF